jgi:tetratricopeptide (TPR) repeat protein
LAQAEEAANAGFDEQWLFGTHAQALVELGRADEAIQLIQPILDDAPEYAFGQSVYLEALDELDRATEALAGLDRWFPPDDPPAGWGVWATTARGQLLVHCARHREAVRVMQEALLASPSEPGWLVTLGLAKARLFEFPQAIDAFRQTIELSVEDPDNWLLLDLADALVMHDGDRGEATELYERVARATSSETMLPEPPAPRLALEAGWAHLRLGRAEDAIAQFRAGLEESPNPQLGARLRLTAAIALAGRGEEAHAELDAVVKAVAGLDDRACAAGVIDDGRFAFKLLEADRAWESSRERLAHMRERLSGKG